MTEQPTGRIRSVRWKGPDGTGGGSKLQQEYGIEHWDQYTKDTYYTHCAWRDVPAVDISWDERELTVMEEK